MLVSTSSACSIALPPSTMDDGVLLRSSFLLPPRSPRPLRSQCAEHPYVFPVSSREHVGWRGKNWSQDQEPILTWQLSKFFLSCSRRFHSSPPVNHDAMVHIVLHIFAHR